MIEKKMRHHFLLAITAAALCGAGCGSKGKTLGKPSKAPLSTVLAVHAGDAPSNLSLEGKMVEKCPQAGCWFRLQDETGVIMVDTKTAGFVVTKIPLNTKVKVSGRLDRDGEVPRIQATGLIY